MQGQRSTIDSYHETFEFDHRSDSNNRGTEQQFFWDNAIDQVESQLPGYLLPGIETNFTFANTVSNDERRLSGWAFGETSSNPSSGNLMSHDEGKMEHGWPSVSDTHTGIGPRMEGRQHDTTNILSSGSGHQIADGSLFLQNSNSDNVHANVNINAGYGGNNADQVSETSSCPHFYESGGSEIEQRLYAGDSSNSSGAASGSTGNLAEEIDGMPGCSLDNRRLSCKRKALEGVSGQSSVGGTPSCIHRAENSIWHSPPARYNLTSGFHAASSSDNSPGVNAPEQLNRRLGVGTRTISDNHSGIGGHVESSQRNSRARTPSNPPPAGTSIRNSYTRSLYQSSSRALPFSRSLDLRPITAGMGSSLAPRNMQPFQWNSAFNSRAGSSSSSPVSSGERMALQREVNSRSISGNILEHNMFVPSTETRNLAQDPRHWSLANGDSASPATAASSSRVSSSSDVRPSPSPTVTSHQNLISQRSRSLSEVVRRSLFPSSGSEFGGQGHNISPQLTALSGSAQDVLPSGAGHLGHHQPYNGSALWTDRQVEGVIGVPLSFRPLAAGSEGRSRLVSEIRNVLDFMRRAGEGFRFEDVFVLDQSFFYGGNDVHDRHRDMRLDVDNMTYEELLALEERIGNVSTGLSEETIMKFLKQRRYFSMSIEPHPELEPCCICQEEYVEGEDLGVLDCGHDFHTPCIKQWLTHKNLCPICKTTALVT